MGNGIKVIARMLLATGLLLGAIFLFMACTSQQRFPRPPMAGDDVEIPVVSLPVEVPQFFSYSINGKDVNFFVIRMHDRILSFLDACLTCYPRKLGYASQEGFVVCRACDTRYSIYKLEKGIGGCFPIRIEGTREGDLYRISKSTFDRHTGKF